MLFPAPLAKITVICYNVVKKNRKKGFPCAVLEGMYAVLYGVVDRSLRETDGMPISACAAKDSSRRTRAAVCYRGNMVLIALIGKQYPQVPETSVYSAPAKALFAYAERRESAAFFGTLVSLA